MKKYKLSQLITINTEDLSVCMTELNGQNIENVCLQGCSLAYRKERGQKLRRNLRKLPTCVLA